MDLKQTAPTPPKKPKYAAALRYRPETDRAPVVVASGCGATAEAILRLAAQAGIPQQVEPALAPILAKIAPGTEIPESTYQLVASILAFIWRMDQSYPTKGVNRD